MADNTTTNPGTGGDTIGSDDIGGVKYQRVKMIVGADGVNDGDVASGNPLPVDTGLTTQTDALTDTQLRASAVPVDGSGVTQPISASSLPLPASAATGTKQDTGNTSLASIDGKITAVNTGAVVISSGAITATGNVADSATDSGNPVKVGGKYNSTLPTYTDGQRGDLQITSRGALNTQIGIGTGAATPISGAVTNTDGQATSSVGSKIEVVNRNYVFNGTTFDRMLGNATDGTLVNLGANNDVTVTSGSIGTTNLPSTVDTNSGNKSSSTLRVVLATDQPALTNKLLVTPDSVALPANQSVNVSQINGVTTTMGNGASGTGVQRVTLANDSTGKLATVDTITNVVHVDDNSSSLTVDGTVTANLSPATSGGLTTINASSSDGATALTNSSQVLKASAGQLFGYYIYNPNSAAAFVCFYNTASASVVVGTTNPLFMLTIPPLSAANLMGETGITFSNAGWAWAATSTAGGNGALTTALDATAWIK